MSLHSQLGLAQEQVTNDLTFNEGVYLSFEAFQRNQPELSWEEVRYDAHGNKDKRAIQFKDFNRIDTITEVTTPIAQDSIWGVCVNGVPYIRVFIPSRGVSEFEALRTRGRICYFTFDGFVEREVPMTIYDPHSGEPLLRKNVINKEMASFEKMLHFETGDIKDFNIQYFKQWIADDERLIETLEAMDVADIQTKLYKTLKIYNDRNPVYTQ